MSTDYKNVRLTKDAYHALERRKREGETFSEAVARLASERPISDLAGLFTDTEIEEIRAARSRAYDEYSPQHRAERE
ncbi:MULTISPECIES: antitoxin VapB family protein [unclassified Haladaptatus]|uniref:antitoxin VapB family protein n=1 Tax=unclassified Haladaptatus TaxID=2622732 RepID=UPI0023E774B5|nr:MULTISPECIES: antitoxin VapB family protein [unclassified Haladaptatus]